MIRSCSFSFTANVERGRTFVHYLGVVSWGGGPGARKGGRYRQGRIRLMATGARIDTDTAGFP